MAGVPTMVPPQVWDGARTGLSGCFAKGPVGFVEVASPMALFPGLDLSSEGAHALEWAGSVLLLDPGVQQQ